mmetsp:Transcript_19413/g.65094  ORF Transcript_19413/g.65094 Transcript_19413/m.65094 type:complete len:317 (-) Transcript_19413:348-1298(-)
MSGAILRMEAAIVGAWEGRPQAPTRPTTRARKPRPACRRKLSAVQTGPANALQPPPIVRARLQALQQCSFAEHKHCPAKLGLQHHRARRKYAMVQAPWAGMTRGSPGRAVVAAHRAGAVFTHGQHASHGHTPSANGTIIATGRVVGPTWGEAHAVHRSVVALAALELRARRKIVKINPEVASAGDKLGPVRMQGRRVDAADHGERDAAHLLERRAVQEDHVIARGHGQRAAVGRDLDARHRPAELQAAGLPQHARVPGAQRAVLGPGHHLLAGGLLGEEEHLDHFVVACQEVGLGLGLGQVEYSHHILLAPRGDAP